ncbi:MAG: limonene-1,2-epoxide hydrolase family protein [Dehalococcoidia bacterium]
MTTNNDTITAFVREFDAAEPDADKLASYFTEDAVYHNIPMQPVNGREAIKAALGGMKAMMLSAGWEVIHQVADGDVVMNERIDRFTVQGRPVEVEVMGVFELRDGKIAAWRDYFDLAGFQKSMAGG